MHRIFTLLIAFIPALSFSQAFYNPVTIPPTLSGTNFTLTVDEDSSEFWPGIKTASFGVNGPLLGPTLILNQGDNVNITVENHLMDVTTMHWHGLHVPAEMDGGPHQEIDTNATWTASFPVLNKAATYWYHPHPHGSTMTQVNKGISGLIIVKDAEEGALNLPRTYGVDDFPVIIQDKSFNGSAQFIADVLSDSMMVNGTLHAMMDCPAQVVRLRLLNGSIARVYNIGFNDNRNFSVIGSDGSLLEQPFSTNRLLISNGERYEILLDLNGMQGDSLILMSYASTMGANIPGGSNIMSGNSPLNMADFGIMQINVIAQTGTPVTTIPSTLINLSPWQESDADVIRAKEMSGTGGPLMGTFYINDLMFDMDVINDTMRLGDIEVWDIINTSSIGHPFHVHDVQFYVVNRNGATPPAYEQGLKDDIFLDADDSIRIIMKFEDYMNDTMPYMYHCHNLRHEDDGMMLQFVVMDSLVGIAERVEGNWRVWPNPVSGEFTIENMNGKGIEKVNLSDIYGQIVIEKDYSDRNMSIRKIETGTLASGIYILEIETGDGVMVKKIVCE